MELLCGKCSQEKGLPLAKRMELAKSRVPNVTYVCPVCEQEHLYKGVVVKAESDPIQPSNEAEKENTTRKKKKTEEHDQLSLF